MADPFVAEIRIFPFNFAPKGWAFCDGQLMPLAQNTALFSLLGTAYGGDGKSNFALPGLQARAPMHRGDGPGLSPRVLGETGGWETVTLVASELPVHAHALSGSSNPATTMDPAGALPAAVSGKLYRPSFGSGPVSMAPESVPPAGGGQPHNNMQPYLTLNFCIALQGVYPPRS
jgi:microcystin-dependent protein